MRRQIEILDTTLRDGEQAPQNAMNPIQKLQMAFKLAELNVDHIETGFPASSKFDFQATQLIRRELPNTGIATFSRTLIADVELALEAGGRARSHTVQMVATGSDIHLKNKRNITRQQSIEEMSNTIRYVRGNSDCRIAMGIEDASRADYGFMGEMTDAAIDAGADQIILADTTGFSTPQEFGSLIRFIKSRAGENVSVSTHCHNDLGLALANTLAGIAAGADEVQVTLGGIGERAGNASLETVASTLFYKAAEYGAYTNIKLDKLYQAYLQLCATVGIEVPRNQPLLGSYVFGTAAGIHQQGMLSDPDTYEFVKPELFNRQREFFVSRHSGKSIIKYILEKNTIPYDSSLVANIYNSCIESQFKNSCMSMVQLESEIIKSISKSPEAGCI